MDTKVWNITQTGSALIGAGLIKIDDVTVGLLLVGIGVALQVLVAVLNKKFDIPVSSPSNNLG